MKSTSKIRVCPECGRENSLREILYELDDPSGIIEAFDRVLVNESLAAYKVEVSFNLAQKYKYADRVKKINLDISWFDSNF